MIPKIRAVLLSLAIIILLMPVMALAGLSNAKVGTSVFNFLKIETAARPCAMGGAFTGVADDESSLYYNPAGIAGLEGRRFIFGYHNNVMDMQSGFLGYIHPLQEGRKVAAYINYLNYGDFIRTDDNGEELGTFSGSDMLIAAGYSMVVNDRLSVGGMAKFIYESVDTYSSTGAAIDLGAKYVLPNQLTSFGLAIQNLGFQFSGFTSGGDKDKLPLLVKGGFSSRLRGLPVLFAADLVYPTDNDLYFAVGAEFLNLKPLFLRLGYTNFGTNYKTDTNKDDLAGFSAGFGIDYKRLQISYTLTPEAELGTSHRVTLSGGF